MSIATVVEGLNTLKDNPDVLRYRLIGSSVVPGCEPKDIDYLVLIPANLNPMVWWPTPVALGDPWEQCGEYDIEDGLWRAIRKGNLNFIVTNDPEFFDGMYLASEVCAAVNLISKRDRVIVHRMIRDGYEREQALALAKDAVPDAEL